MKYLILFMAFCGILTAQSPQTLNYQGYLADSNGDPVNGSENITFRIYDASTGGSALLTEARTVTLNDGVFSVVLGENTPINLPFDTQYWLGITVGGSELSPRTKLASSAYASNLPKVAFVKGVFPANTTEGAFNTGAWRTRDLNTVEGDNSIVNLSANRFTISEGKYIIEASAPGHVVSRHQIRLRNITDGTTDIQGNAAYTNTDVVTYSSLEGVLEINSSKEFEIQHYCQVSRSPDGFGVGTSGGGNSIFTQVKITKIAN